MPCPYPTYRRPIRAAHQLLLLLYICPRDRCSTTDSAVVLMLLLWHAGRCLLVLRLLLLLLSHRQT
jgi:hypothetical protein